MKVILHEFANMAELGDTTNQSSSNSENTVQTPKSQADIGEAKTKRSAIVKISTIPA